jgi:hypothetical protein
MKAESGDGQNEPAEAQWLRDVERERGEQERKHKALLEEFGVTEEELAQWPEERSEREERREAAYDASNDYEFCLGLVSKYARCSARRTGDAISNVRDRYELIVADFLAARYVQRDGGAYSLSSVLLCECGTDEALKEFLASLGRWIKRFALRYYVYREPHNTWVMPGIDVRAIKTLRGRSVSERMMKALAIEHERDPRALKEFLKAVFKRWRKTQEPRSVLRQRLFSCQVTGRSKEIAGALQEIGAAPRTTTPAHLRSLDSRVRQYRRVR